MGHLLFQIADLANEDTPQVYALCGRGSRSSLRVLRHGLEVTEMAVSELPGNPNAVWTVKMSSAGKKTTNVLGSVECVVVMYLKFTCALYILAAFYILYHISNNYIVQGVLSYPNTANLQFD